MVHRPQWRCVMKMYVYPIKLQICMCTQTADILSLYMVYQRFPKMMRVIRKNAILRTFYQ